MPPSILSPRPSRREIKGATWICRRAEVAPGVRWVETSLSIRSGPLLALGGLWGLTSILVSVVMVGLEPSTGRSPPPVGEAAEIWLPEASMDPLLRAIEQLGARIDALESLLHEDSESST